MQYKCNVNTFKKQCKCLCKMLGVRKIQVLLSGTFWIFFFFNVLDLKLVEFMVAETMIQRAYSMYVWQENGMACLASCSAELQDEGPAVCQPHSLLLFCFSLLTYFFCFLYIIWLLTKVGQPFNYLLLFVLSLLFAILVCFSFLSVRVHRFNLHLFQWI